MNYIFNKESRIMLREAVNKKIKELKNTIDRKDKFTRLHVDKEWLEPLLFDERIDKDGKHYKTIGYTYDNLRYIDLSEANFEDVSFDFRSYGCDKTLSEDEKNKKILNLGGINAKIDFMKSYEMRKFCHLILSNINFWGTDLSLNNYVDEHGVSVFEKAKVKNCEFTHTDLMISTSNIMFSDSKLLRVNLSKVEMEADEALLRFQDCDIRESGLNIVIVEETLPESIREIMNNEYFEGCKINGKRILSKQKLGERAAGINYAYEAWRDAMIDDVVNSFDKQVSDTKRGFNLDTKKETDISNKKKGGKTPKTLKNVPSVTVFDNIDDAIESEENGK